MAAPQLDDDVRHRLREEEPRHDWRFHFRLARRDYRALDRSCRISKGSPRLPREASQWPASPHRSDLLRAGILTRRDGVYAGHAGLQEVERTHVPDVERGVGS